MVTFDDFRQTAWSCAPKIGLWLHEVLVLSRDPFTALVDLWDQPFAEANGGVGLFSATRGMTITGASGRLGVPNGWQAGYWACHGCQSQRFENCETVRSEAGVPWNDRMQAKCAMPVCEPRLPVNVGRTEAMQSQSMSTMRDANRRPIPDGLQTSEARWTSSRGKDVSLAACQLLPPYLERMDGTGWTHFVANPDANDRVPSALRIDEWKWMHGLDNSNTVGPVESPVPLVSQGPRHVGHIGRSHVERGSPSTAVESSRIPPTDRVGNIEQEVGGATMQASPAGVTVGMASPH